MFCKILSIKTNGSGSPAKLITLAEAGMALSLSKVVIAEGTVLIKETSRDVRDNANAFSTRCSVPPCDSGTKHS
ncbi:hypothetical protein AWV80_07055 [Cupriavidus sp. UYMU48A]|nr:hypothetical protein AWV80_07055 [Cupriavidus sp. UYMU48A]